MFADDWHDANDSKPKNDAEVIIRMRIPTEVRGAIRVARWIATRNLWKMSDTGAEVSRAYVTHWSVTSEYLARP
jgi:hypothetical protein